MAAPPALLRDQFVPDDALELLLELLVYLRPVLWPHEHRGIGERRVVQTRPMALYHSRRQNGNHVRREPEDFIKNVLDQSQSTQNVSRLVT